VKSAECAVGLLTLSKRVAILKGFRESGLACLKGVFLCASAWKTQLLRERAF
jgi:hypothetical protein